MIYEIDFTKLKEIKEKKYIPVLAVLNKTIYTLLPNKTNFNSYLKNDKQNDLFANVYYKLCKVFYYYYNSTLQLETKMQEYLDKPIIKDKILFATEPENLSIYKSFSSKIIKSHNININNYYVKFASNRYVETNNINLYNNLVIIKKVINEALINDFKLYIYEYNDNLDYDIINKELKPIITRFLKRKTKFIKKDSNRYIGKINAEVLSEFEKLSNKIDKEFNKKIFLGDIEINQNEENILFNYLKTELNKLKNTSNLDNYFPIRPKVFAVALVMFEAKYYGPSKNHGGQNAFWSYFKNELDVEITNQSQRERLVKIFDEILIEKNKDKNVSEEYNTRLENSRRSFERILVHSFVSDRYSFDLFDRLLLLWQQIYFSNYEEYSNMEESKEQLDSWIENKKENAQIGNSVIGDIKLSTALAFTYNKSSARSKLHRIIRLIDNAYYSMKIIPDSNRRLDHLLHIWMDNPKGKFKKLYKENYKDSKQRGKSLLFMPVIKFDNVNNNFYLYFPQQFIKNYDGINPPIWEISYNSKIISIDPGLFTQEAGEYTKEVTFNLYDIDIFNKFKISLKSNTMVYKTYSILADNIRFFNNQGGMLLPPLDFLPSGNLDIFSNLNGNIKNSAGKEYKFSSFNQIYELNQSLNENEIIILNDGRVLKVGSKINEGIDDSSLADNCFIKHNNEKYKIYSKLPSLLFKNKKVKSVSLFINEVVNKVNLDNPYKFDNNEDDIYGYIIDLNQYITNNGIYTIRLRNYREDLIFNIAYIKDFTYKFNDAPYIFNSEGSISFPSSINMVINKDWDISDFTLKTLHFSFDENSENYYNRIENQHIIVDYNMAGYKDPMPIYFKIPALFWKFNENDEWSFRKIKNLSYKTMPSTLYLSAPFNLKKTYLTYDYTLDEDYIDKLFPDNNENYAIFNLHKIKNNINRTNKINRLVYFNIKNIDEQYNLFTLICKSKLVSRPKIYGDFTNNKILGNVEIIGDADFYSVEAYYENEENLIGEATINKNGEFEIEYELQMGKYLLKFYENDEDEFGFDCESIQIDNTFVTNIINIYNLESNKIILNGFYNKNNKYEKKIDFGKNKYIINNLKNIEVKDFDKDIISETLDEDPIQIYNGDLSYIRYEQEIKYDDCLILFFDKYDISKNIILIKNDDEYTSIMFNKNKQMLLTDSDVQKEKDKFIADLRNRRILSNARLIYNNYLTLFSDLYKFDIDIK